MGKIFISHSSVNNAEALAIDDWLHAQGWADTFLDLDPRRGLVAGDRWQAALKSAADSCELILIVISPDWAASRWCLAEFLLAKSLNKQIVGVLVKPTPYETLPPELTAEWQLVDLTSGKMGWTTTIQPPRLPNETVVAFSEAGLARLSAGLQKVGLDPSHFPWPPSDDPDRPPFRGLLPLDAGDAGIFFGRDGMIVLTLDGLRGLRARAAPRFATILGASGAGKSSFLRAGLLPRLERDSRHFQVLPVLRPERAALTGEHGLAASLMAALAARNIRINRADVRNAVLAGADSVAPLLKQIVAPVDAASAPETPPVLVLAVDQAEELLEPGDSASEATALLKLLSDLAKRDDPALLVIFTIRSDGYGRLQDRAELGGTKPHHLIDLSPMPVGSYGDVIRGPARRLAAGGRKLDLEEPLVDALLEDIHSGGGKDALPLLAFTLERLYRDYGADGDLRLTEYEQLGRIGGAIEAAVDQALKSADGNTSIPADRAARLALLRRGLIPWLAGIDPDTRAPRRRVARLSEVPDEARPLIQLMVEQRLLSTDKDEATGETTIEPAHEALLRQWGALDGWLVEDSADLALLEAVRRAATDWAANAKAPEFLVHKGARLGAAETAADQDKFEAYLNSTDREYLRSAREAENAALRAAAAARIRVMVLSAVVGAVLIIGSIVGYFVWQAGETARLQARANFQIAQSEAALRAGRPEEGAKAALGAYDLLPSTATRTNALNAAMSISPHALGSFSVAGTVIDAAWLADGKAATLSADGTVTTFDPATGATATGRATSDAQAIGLIAPSDGLRIVYADGSIAMPDGTIVAKGNDQFFGQAGKVTTNEDGEVIAMVGLAGDAMIRDCRSLPCADRLIAPPEGASAAQVAAVSPPGDLIAILFDSGVLAIETLAPGGTPTSFTIPALSSVRNLVWTGTGEKLLAADRNGILVVDPATGAVDGDTFKTVAASTLTAAPAVGIMALGCDRHLLCLYDEAGRFIEAFAGHQGALSLLRWNADVTALISVAPKEPVRLWSLDPDKSISYGLRSRNGTSLTALALDPARGLTAAGDESGTIWVWTNDERLKAYDAKLEPTARVASLAFLGDGRLAAVYENRAVGVWSLGKDAPDKLLKIDNASFSRVAALDGDVRAVVPLTDKRQIVLSGDDLRDAEIAPDEAGLTPWGVAAAGANTAFVSYSDGSIRKRDLGAGTDSVLVYDAGKPLCGAEPTTDNNGAKSLDVSGDGKWLVATRTDARVIVHNLQDPAKPICIALLAPDSKTVAFSPDSGKLAILSATDRLYVFDLSRPDEAIILGAPAVPENSPIAIAAGPARTTSWLEWRDDDTLAITTFDGTVELVRLDPQSWRARVDSLSPRQ